MFFTAAMFTTGIPSFVYMATGENLAALKDRVLQSYFLGAFGWWA